jgi:hypothetical protein
MALLHAGLSTSILYFMLIAGLWGLTRAALKRGIDSNYWGILVIGELVLVVQATLGLLLWFGGARPGRGGIHMLYGAVSALALPAYFAISRGREDRRAAFFYGLLCLLLVALSIRASITGGSI